MKKILLSIGLFCLVLVGKSQVVLNEIYGNPGNGNSEFIELYNSSAAGSISTDCITILSYYEEGPNTGWYVIDLPAGTIAPKSWYTVSAANPFNVQGTVGVVSNANWNSLPASGYLQKWQRNGATYTSVAPGTVTNLMQETSPSGANGQNYFVLLLQNGVPTNGFWGGGPTGTLPAGITGMPNLSLTPAGAGCAGAFSVNFATWGAVEFFNPAGGSDNGYARTCDGRCGSWTKTSSQVNHTPNATNGSVTSCTGATPMVTAEFINCASSPRFVSADISALGSGGATEADDFPVKVTVYADVNINNALDGADLAMNLVPALINTVAQAPVVINIPDAYKNYQMIVVYETKRGCFDKVVVVPNSCIPLPVEFKSFTAIRNRNTVNLRWETAQEINNSGFAIERNVNGNWQQIGWVPSQALNGTSDVALVYTFADMSNTTRGVSQYRIRQVDLDSKSKYSDIRSVRGEGQLGKTIVYPNPSVDGKINVVFDDAAVTREISVLDISGRMIRQIKGITSNNVSIGDLNPGMYTLRIIAVETGEQSVEKVIVNKR